MGNCVGSSLNIPEIVEGVLEIDGISAGPRAGEKLVGAETSGLLEDGLLLGTSEGELLGESLESGIVGNAPVGANGFWIE
jgi:hypothetical protein